MIYESTIPVLIAADLAPAGPALYLDSYATGRPILGPSDAARATTSATSVTVTVFSADPAITIDAVDVDGIRDAPETVSWTEDEGTYTGLFPAPESVDEYSWDLSVTVTVATTQERKVVILDPLMIVRKTNP